MDQIITKVQNPFPYLKIENMYSEEELELIAEELKFLTYPEKLDEPLFTGSAKEEGKVIKENKGLFLDNIYKKREISNILKINRKLFSLEYMDSYANLSFGYKSIKECNHDATLISYYENGGYYKPHKDISTHTAVTWFFREPKLFTGGDFYFTEYKEKIEIKHNMTVMFPSFVLHSVDEVSMPKDLPPGFGRYSMTQFISFLN